MKFRGVFLAVVVVAGMVVVSHSVVYAQGVTYFATLVGGNEVSPEGEAGAGDPNGYGSATVILVGASNVCFGIVFHRIETPTAGHIHANVAGVNGDIVIPLFGDPSPIPAPSSGSPGSVSGCVAADDLPDPSAVQDAIERIRANPSKFYVNVHTPPSFPGGAIRGQLY
jgi:CHRD domain